YLDGAYPFTGEITAEKVDSVFKQMVSISICPYQAYGVRYFDIVNGLIGPEVDYFDAKYSFGTKISYVDRLVEDFGVGMSVGTNLTFDSGEVFGNIAPMMELSSVLFRYNQFEVISSIGFGGFITFNEESLSVVPGMSAAVGMQFTVDEDMVFKVEAGLDAGLWLWKTLSAKGFMMAIQKPIMFGVGVRV
ncbi:MAG: hypothetical protein KBS81_11345, partial [Spirochaetales bacterium]|nr:hypothetical protein [Candidatus Physcosoma equi]